MDRDKHLLHKKRCEQMIGIQNQAYEIFDAKNRDYGDAFAKYSVIGVLVRIGDKITRLMNIDDSKIQLVHDESFRDTLLDLHNYAAMALMLHDEQQFEDEVPQTENMER